MKHLLTVFLFINSIAVYAQDQQAKPQLLKEPGDWQFERFALPPVFAPDFPYKGAEELRFSPGMFRKDSVTYFTYAFVAELDNRTAISQDNVRNYLVNYFKGLCASTANERKLVVDTTKITVMVEKKKGTGTETIYNAWLNIFGVFQDGAPVKLNMEVKVLLNSATKKGYLIFIASPREKSDAIWKSLYKIQQDFKIPS